MLESVLSRIVLIGNFLLWTDLCTVAIEGETHFEFVLSIETTSSIKNNTIHVDFESIYEKRGELSTFAQPRAGPIPDRGPTVQGLDRTGTGTGTD